MDIDRGVVKVGFEIEIPAWSNHRTFRDVASDLLDADYMAGTMTDWLETHKYHCRCDKGGCRVISSGKVVVPPLVSMTYDGSLPKTGAEFITSPIILSEIGLRDMIEEMWDIIVKDAEWRDDLPDYYENGMASPSIHMHVSANLGDMVVESTRSQASLQQDILHSLTLFTPELFLLADVAGYRRGIKFRLPTRESIEKDVTAQIQGHHGFVQVKRTIPGQLIYLEWRLFEAAYHDWDYIEGSAYLASAITRAYLADNVISYLMSIGYQFPYDDRAMADAVAENDAGLVIDQVSKERLEALRNMCKGQLADDVYGLERVETLFNKAEERVLHEDY